MLNQFSRLELGIGTENLNKLKGATVAIIGIGGVGSYSVEALVRSGIGKLILVDKDVVDITNINRQIHATHKTVGLSKVEVMKARCLEINPNCDVVTMHMFFNDETKGELFAHHIDFLVDASDTITFKILLIKECLRRKIKFISSMGAANKLDPTKFEISDITKTSVDPLARVIRQKLKKDGVKGKVPVVYSKEEPRKQIAEVMDVVGNEDATIRKAQLPPASNGFVPSVAGLICASYVVRKLIGE